MSEVRRLTLGGCTKVQLKTKGERSFVVVELASIGSVIPTCAGLPLFSFRTILTAVCVLHCEALVSFVLEKQHINKPYLLKNLLMPFLINEYAKS